MGVMGDGPYRINSTARLKTSKNMKQWRLMPERPMSKLFAGNSYPIFWQGHVSTEIGHLPLPQPDLLCIFSKHDLFEK